MDMHDVYSVAFSDGLWTVDYSVTPADGPMEHCKITRGDRPHPDFIAVYVKFIEMAARFLEMPLLNANGEEMKITVKNIKLGYHKKYGCNVKILVECSPMTFSGECAKMTTPVFYEISKGTGFCKRVDGKMATIGLNKLTQEELQDILIMKEEAFLYAYAQKREQVTLDEAAAEYEKAQTGGEE